MFMVADLVSLSLYLFLCELFIHSNEPRQEISNNAVYATSKGSDQHVHTRSLIRVFTSCLNILWTSFGVSTLKKNAAQACLISLHLSKCHLV